MADALSALGTLSRLGALRIAVEPGNAVNRADYTWTARTASVAHHCVLSSHPVWCANMAGRRKVPDGGRRW